MNMNDLNSPLSGLCLISSVSRRTICCSRLTVWRLQPLLKRLPCSRKMVARSDGLKAALMPSAPAAACSSADK